jgi:hypothetical protein
MGWRLLGSNKKRGTRQKFRVVNNVRMIPLMVMRSKPDQFLRSLRGQIRGIMDRADKEFALLKKKSSATVCGIQLTTARNSIEDFES